MINNLAKCKGSRIAIHCSSPFGETEEGAFETRKTKVSTGRNLLLPCGGAVRFIYRTTCFDIANHNNTSTTSDTRASMLLGHFHGLDHTAFGFWSADLTVLKWLQL